VAGVADVAVVGDEVDAETIYGHRGRGGLIARPPHQPGLFPTGFDISDVLRAPFILDG